MGSQELVRNCPSGQSPRGGALSLKRSQESIRGSEMTKGDKLAVERALEYILDSPDALDEQERRETLLALAHLRKDKVLEFVVKGE